MQQNKKGDQLLERGIEETLVTDFAVENRNSYGDFLQLKTLLNLQKTFQDQFCFGFQHCTGWFWHWYLHPKLLNTSNLNLKLRPK